MWGGWGGGGVGWWCVFFFNDTATTEIYTLSLHDALPIYTLIAGPGAEGRALRLAEAGVAVVCMHTNFDAATGGTADSLAAALGLSDVIPFGRFDDAHDVDGSEGLIGRVGTVSPQSLGALARTVGRVLRSEARIAGRSAGPVNRVAVLPGSGSDFIGAAASTSCDVLVTGDVSHHRAREAIEMGICVIDPGHAPTERPGVAALYSFVESIVGEAIDMTAIDDSPWETD